MTEPSNLFSTFIAGCIAGLVTDIVLFPLDTIKTRLQSKEGFSESGGFKGVYKGIVSAASGSMPTSALFFVIYECLKPYLKIYFYSDVVVNMLSSSLAAAAASVLRIPFEVVKQKAQSTPDMNSRSALVHILKEKGFRGLFQGYFSMLFRDVPFTFLEMTLWELLKLQVVKFTFSQITSLQSAICGSIAGGIAAALTTPLDVMKTRVILSENSNSSLLRVLKDIATNGGIAALYSGIIPRVTWISIGGFVFLGSYDQSKYLTEFYLL